MVAFMGMLGHNCFDVSMRFVSSGVYLGLLSGMVVNLAREFHYQVSLIDWTENDDDWWLYSSTWMILTRDKRILSAPGR